MQRTYHVSLARAGWIGLAAISIVLAHPGTSIAGGTSESNRAAAGGATLLQRGAGYADGGERASVEAHLAALDEALAPEGDEVGRARAGADEVDSHSAASLRACGEGGRTRPSRSTTRT